jgi:hypothetical protein
MSERSSVPSSRLHKQSGQAIVTLSNPVTGKRRDVLLGSLLVPTAGRCAGRPALWSSWACFTLFAVRPPCSPGAPGLESCQASEHPVGRDEEARLRRDPADRHTDRLAVQSHHRAPVFALQDWQVPLERDGFRAGDSLSASSLPSRQIMAKPLPRGV